MKRSKSYYQHVEVKKVYSPKQLKTLSQIEVDTYLPNASLTISRRITLYRHKETIRSSRSHTPIKESGFSDFSKKLLAKWNTFGHPFTTHKQVKSKTVISALSKLERFMSEGFKSLEIRAAIELGHEVFTSKWFRHYYHFRSNNISLSSFLEYTDRDKKHDAFVAKAKVDSWFKEFVAGEDWVRRNFSLVDKDPKLTKLFQEAWIQYSGEEPDGRDMQAFREATKNLLKLCKKNEKYCGPAPLMGTVEDILKDWKNNKRFNPSASYIGNKKFWNHDIPNQLVKENVISSTNYITKI